MRHPYRIVSIHRERLSTMRTLAWVIVLVVIAANEPARLFKIIIEFISTQVHTIGLKRKGVVSWQMRKSSRKPAISSGHKKLKSQKKGGLCFGVQPPLTNRRP